LRPVRDLWREAVSKNTAIIISAIIVMRILAIKRRGKKEKEEERREGVGQKRREKLDRCERTSQLPV
jgi:hypothetical protein